MQIIYIFQKAGYIFPFYSVNHNSSTQALICVLFLQNVSLSIHSYLVLHMSKSVLKKKIMPAQIAFSEYDDA